MKIRGSTRKKVLILFEGTHIAYSPTVIGLYDELTAANYDVTIIAPLPTHHNQQKLPDRQVIYTQIHFKRINRLYNLIFKLNLFLSKTIKIFKRNKFDFKEYFYNFLFIKKKINSIKPDYVIAVDFKNLFYSEILGLNVEFLSLELGDEPFKPLCSYNNINSVIIQSEDRLEYIFKNVRDFKIFYIQNSPVHKELNINYFTRKDLIYCGTAWKYFGFDQCLDFLYAYPQFSLTVKGMIIEKDKVLSLNKNLIKQKRLKIDDYYIDDQQIIEYLNQFYIGFCFYNFEIPEMNHFNYYSAPSGKLFKYLAAGVPVIAIDIPGFKFVKQFDCGVLIKDLQPLTIKQAIEKIEADYDNFSSNCSIAAKHYCFHENTKPFIAYLQQK